MKQIIYQIADKKIVWVWDAEETNAAAIEDDNLTIMDSNDHVIWNMQEIMGRKDACVKLKVIDDSKIQFVTWNGWNVIYDVVNMELISKTMTK